MNQRTLKPRLGNGIIEYCDEIYGHVATISKVPDGQCMGGMHLITWNNDCLGWGPMWKHSLKAAEYIILAYVHELEEAGH